MGKVERLMVMNISSILRNRPFLLFSDWPLRFELCGVWVTNNMLLWAEFLSVHYSEKSFPGVNSWNWTYCFYHPAFAFRLQLCQTTVAPFSCPTKYKSLRPAIFRDRDWREGPCVCTSVLASGWVCLRGRSSCLVMYLEFLVTFTVVNGIFSFCKHFFTWPWTRKTLHQKRLAVFS